jgi:hypothetical protein
LIIHRCAHHPQPAPFPNPLHRNNSKRKAVHRLSVALRSVGVDRSIARNILTDML